MVRAVQGLLPGNRRTWSALLCVQVLLVVVWAAGMAANPIEASPGVLIGGPALILIALLAPPSVRSHARGFAPRSD